MNRLRACTPGIEEHKSGEHGSERDSEHEVLLLRRRRHPAGLTASWALAAAWCLVAVGCGDAGDAAPPPVGGVTASHGPGGMGNAGGWSGTSTGYGGQNYGGNNSGSAAGGNAQGLSLATPPQDPGTPADSPSKQDQCGSIQVDATVESRDTVVEVPGNVLFVFDRSASMDGDWNTTSKWRAANDALVAAFEPLQSKLRAGVILFPSASNEYASSSSSCNWLMDPLCFSGATDFCPEVAPIASAAQIPIQTGATFLNAWKSYWASAMALGSGTPTEKALLQAEAALATPPAGRTAVVLMTDGQPTCGSNEAAVASRLLNEKHIPTYVVGLPGAAEGTLVLDSVAMAGGSAPAGCISNCFLSPSNPADLQAALANIVTTTVTTTTVRAVQDCSFKLDPPKDADPASVHLIVTNATTGEQFEVPQTPGNGWSLSSDNRTAKLEGLVCDQAKAGAFASFGFQYGCVAVPELPIR